MLVHHLTLLLATVTSLAACGTQPSPSQPQRRTRPAVDKAAIYGDAALMPTRRGERAREELALAGEIAAAMETLPELREPQVSVTLPARPDDAGSVLVAARTPAIGDARRIELERDLLHMTHSVIPAMPTSGVTVVLSEVGPPDPASPRTLPQLPLAIAILGLGISLGVAGERIHRRRSA